MSRLFVAAAECIGGLVVLGTIFALAGMQRRRTERRVREGV